MKVKNFNDELKVRMFINILGKLQGIGMDAIGETQFRASGHVKKPRTIC